MGFRRQLARCACRPGFGRLEWVVALGVLVVGGYLLFQANEPVRERVRSAMCRTQMRRMALALRMYADDHDGFFPLADTWDQAIVASLGVRPPYSCPDVELSGVVGRAGRRQTGKMAAGYAINAYLVRSPQRFGDPEPSTPNMARAAHPGVTIAFAEAPVGLSILHEPYRDRLTWGQRLDGGRRHDGGANYSFLDGHVQWYLPEDVNGLDDRLPPDGVSPDFRP